MKRLAMAVALLAACGASEEEEEPTDRILCNQQWPLGAGTISVQYCARACQTPPTYQECDPVDDPACVCEWTGETGEPHNASFYFIEPSSGLRGICTFKDKYDPTYEEIVFHACDLQ